MMVRWEEGAESRLGSWRWVEGFPIGMIHPSPANQTALLQRHSEDRGRYLSLIVKFWRLHLILCSHPNLLYISPGLF